ncbi:AAA family ATPase [Actinomadura mexicana]|uniref:DNA segregation ATPase FtsK/SpoIIIE, S-DNA-T family n=1 Tax=Actinomadura mexicana TaxID=134959 RepID=A0A238VKU4_9ACTN|nr:AAA family ATPase [Actinomadura mexicana]SNR34985.1 DNA segregation ATPase FtsK/SpoIIIE, S-DNA-T family [Actinomadura mexicana]
MPESMNGHAWPTGQTRTYVPAGQQPRPVLLDKPPAGARPVDPVELLDVEEIQGQAVVAEPVDQPDNGPGVGWIAERRGRLDAAPQVFPVWLRDRSQLTDSAWFVARWYGQEAAFHSVRAPLYTLRLWAGAPRGTTRAGRAWWRWVTDADARPVEAKAALSDPDTWTRFITVQSRRTGPRRRLSLVVAVPAVLLVTLAAVLLPGWALTAAGAVALSVLGWVGKDPDRPIVTRYVAVHLQRRLDSSEIETALEAIGIKGRVDFTAPIQVDGPGWRAELDLPRSTTAAKVLDKREDLAAAMRRPISTVWPEGDRAAHPGRLVLWVAREDPAKSPRKLWPLMRDGQADVFGALPFGFDPRGNLVTITLMYSNLLVGGIPGSGKTSCALAIVLACALDPTAKLHVFELKGSGDLHSVQAVCHRYVSGDDDEDLQAALEGLRAGIVEQKRRAEFIKGLPASQTPEGRRVTRALVERYPEQDLGPRVIVVDEAQELFTHPDYKDEAADLCTRLIKKGRAYGIILILLTQNPDAPSLPSSVSSSVGTRLCLAVMDWRSNNNVLGTGAHERGLRATEISASEQGTGILVRGRDGLTVRAAFIKQTEAEEIGKRALALRIAAGTLSGQAAGETVQAADQTTLIDHLRAVWPAGEDAVHSWPLVQALAVYRPDLYAEWVPADSEGLDEAQVKEARTAAATMLANALKRYGVTTRQINRRGAGGGGKGVRWDDLAALDED